MSKKLNIAIDLIRHGQTDRNLQQNQLIGQSPEEPLNTTGIEQSNKLHDYFQKQGIKHSAIFCSPYIRAQQTCAILFPDCQADVKTIDELREINQGDGRNKLRADLYQAGQEEYYDFLGMSHHHPNGESLYDVEWRMKTFLERDILNAPWEDREQRIAVITHGMCIKTVLHLILGYDHRMAWRIDIDNSSVSSLQYRNGFWRVKTVNATNHLT